jgi:hypothetical protein
MLPCKRYILLAGNVLIETCMREKEAFLAFLLSRMAVVDGDRHIAGKVWSFLHL